MRVVKNRDFLDLLKMILILMVLAIHVPLGSGVSLFGIDILPPLLRTAVPIFFLMSSFFFFSMYKDLSAIERRFALQKFIVRNLALYAIWFFFCLPVTLYLKWNWWFGGGFFRGIILFLMNFIVGGTFVASWFIVALVIAVVLVAYLSRRVSNTVLLIVGSVFYAFAAFCSSYSPILEKAMPELRGIGLYRAIVLLAPTSFCSAFVWIALGKIVAEQEEKLKSALQDRAWLFPFLLTAYYMEVVSVFHYIGGKGGNDCYFLLVPVSFLAFIFFLCVSVEIPKARYLRSLSTVCYVCHGSAFVVIDWALHHFGIVDHARALKFLIGFSVCILAFIALRCAAKCKALSWLKYSY